MWMYACHLIFSTIGKCHVVHNRGRVRYDGIWCKGGFVCEGVLDFVQPDSEFWSMKIRVFEDNQGTEVLAEILSIPPPLLA